MNADAVLHNTVHAHVDESSALAARLREIDAATPLEVRLASRNQGEAIRLATAGKGYKPAPQWTFCQGCAQPCSSTERLAIEPDGSVRHERCR